MGAVGCSFADEMPAIGRTFYGPQTVFGVLETTGTVEGHVSSIFGVLAAATAEEYLLKVSAQVFGGETTGVELLFERGLIESRVRWKSGGEGLFAQVMKCGRKC